MQVVGQIKTADEVSVEVLCILKSVAEADQRNYAVRVAADSLVREDCKADETERDHADGNAHDIYAVPGLPVFELRDVLGRIVPGFVLAVVVVPVLNFAAIYKRVQLLKGVQCRRLAMVDLFIMLLEVAACSLNVTQTD